MSLFCDGGGNDDYMNGNEFALDNKISKYQYLITYHSLILNSLTRTVALPNLGYNLNPLWFLNWVQSLSLHIRRHPVPP